VNLEDGYVWTAKLAVTWQCAPVPTPTTPTTGKWAVGGEGVVAQSDNNETKWHVVVEGV
jgi:hypothetical protein